MKTNIIQENVILNKYLGPNGLDPHGLSPHNLWIGTITKEYKKQYPNNKIITQTDDSRILEVGDWPAYFYIIGKTKNAS